MLSLTFVYPQGLALQNILLAHPPDEIAQLMTDPGSSDPWISNANRPFVAAPHQNAAR